jgi:integrase
LEQAYNHIPKRQRMPLFSHAAELWLASKAGLAEKSRERYEQCVEHLKEEFGKRIERHDVGRAIPHEVETDLLAAASQSRSPALLSLILISLDTEMRLGETQALQRKDLSLAWKDGMSQRGEITVPKSKTAAGSGRVIPLSRRECACLSLWLERFSEAGPDSFLFPYHKVGLAGNWSLPVLYKVDLTRPMVLGAKRGELPARRLVCVTGPTICGTRLSLGWRKIQT